ncbi:MAG: hypothetical protein V4594_11260 [Bacteroidota bacterium]
MKIKLLLVLLIFSAEIGYAQKFDVLIKKADELQKAEKLSDALDNYNEAINLVLENKEAPDSQKWLSALYSAGNLAGKMTYKREDASKLAQKYWNMAMGSRAEKLEDKIAFLKDYGVKDLIVYHSYAYTVPYVVEGCSPTMTKYLLWFKDKKTYVQKFNNCEAFKPLVIENSELAAFYPKQKDSVIKQKFITFIRVFDAGEYDLDFIDQTGTTAKTHFQAHALVEPKNEATGSPYKDLDKAMVSYNKNVNSSLGKVVKMVWSDVSQYDRQLDSNAARAKVGQF